MRVLVACEFSGTVRDAFLRRGFDTWSCDLIPTECPGPHIINDVRNVLDWDWDLMIAHPPCTHLAGSGARWFAEGKKDEWLREDALDFVRVLMDAPIERIAIENPVGAISTYIRKPHQIIHPWQFGEPFEKKTCLWLKNLSRLRPTKIMQERVQACHMQSGWYDNQAQERSRTYPGIAEAMADQWSEDLSGQWWGRS